jgi:hypothetical protein
MKSGKERSKHDRYQGGQEGRPDEMENLEVGKRGQSRLLMAENDKFGREVVSARKVTPEAPQQDARRAWSDG